VKGAAQHWSHHFKTNTEKSAMTNATLDFKHANVKASETIEIDPFEDYP